MRIAVVTLFPEMFQAVGAYGVTGRAMDAGLVRVNCVNPRDFTTDRHRTVDDRPFGGGPGMLMKTEPLLAAIGAARNALTPAADDGVAGGKPARVISLSPQGRRLDQGGVAELAACQKLVMICGRYQGIDQRLLDAEVDEEWSLGDYVISGGELAAMVVIDAVTRLQPGALGAQESAELDSFANGLLHCPQYTRPQTVADRDVPDILLSGDHERIRRWRLKQSLGVTWRKRPDLLARVDLDAEMKALLEEFIEEFQATRFPSGGRGEGSGV